NDGGIGAMAALGVRFLDENDEELQPIGKNLIKIKKIDTSKLHPLAAKTTFTVLCDVKNPLIGEKGATYVYGPQKGAVGKYKEELELGMQNYAKIVEEQLKVRVADMPGAGAAGGFGAALNVFLHATLQSGIETLFELVKFDELLDGVDLIITGEGRVDYQSAFGKVLSGIGEHASKKGVPVIAIAGGMGDGAEELYQHGIDSIMTTVNRIITLDEAMERAEEFLENAADRMFRFLSIGYSKLK
ncbi:MAG TPA: glycerate kinase, partial [Mobilitalea sp.]|nr:glycerate kinase [Mobilitalea sp.]